MPLIGAPASLFVLRIRCILFADAKRIVGLSFDIQRSCCLPCARFQLEVSIATCRSPALAQSNFLSLGKLLALQGGESDPSFSYSSMSVLDKVRALLDCPVCFSFPLFGPHLLWLWQIDWSSMPVRFAPPDLSLHILRYRFSFVS